MNVTRDASSPVPSTSGPEHSLATGTAALEPVETLTGETVERLVVLGDIGGQYDAFVTVLGELGIDPADPVLPDGMALVQVGDILRVGDHFPELDNDECVALADALIRVNPGRYIQMVGDHEAAVIGGDGNVNWPVEPELDPIVCDWWSTGLMRVAVTLQVGNRHVLITHAGLTLGYWTELGRPDAISAAQALNTHMGGDINALMRPGQALTLTPSFGADPVNALSGLELLPGWLAHGSPGFDQIHGHSTVWEWATDDWYGSPVLEARQNTHIDHTTRRHCTLIGASAFAPEATITCVDWQYLGEYDARTWPPLLIENASIVA